MIEFTLCSLPSDSSLKTQYNGADSGIATISNGTNQSETHAVVKQTFDSNVGDKTKTFEGYEYLCILL